MTPESGAPAALVRFSALLGTSDWAGAVRLADEVYAALPGVNPDMRAVKPQTLNPRPSTFKPDTGNPETVNPKP